MKKLFRIALAGNPNCGKTSIFNCLTGARQHVGNYPGVTVESKSGKFSIGNIQIELIDLPGIYSLSSISPEEAVAFDELTSGNIDLIINVIDSSAPNRSLPGSIRPSPPSRSICPRLNNNRTAQLMKTLKPVSRFPHPRRSSLY